MINRSTFPLFQVCEGRFMEPSILHEGECIIAPAAEEATNLPGVMVVINREPCSPTIPVARPLRLATDCADASLLLEHLPVLHDPQPIFSE
jgi:hypothetical protein